MELGPRQRSLVACFDHSVIHSLIPFLCPSLSSPFSLILFLERPRWSASSSSAARQRQGRQRALQALGAILRRSRLWALGHDTFQRVPPFLRLNSNLFSMYYMENEYSNVFYSAISAASPSVARFLDLTRSFLDSSSITSGNFFFSSFPLSSLFFIGITFGPWRKYKRFI